MQPGLDGLIASQQKLTQLGGWLIRLQEIFELRLDSQTKGVLFDTLAGQTLMTTKKDQKEIKGTTKPLMANLDITPRVWPVRLLI